MRCSLCDRVMLSRSSQTIEKDGGALVITVWGCSACHHTEEEIWASRGYPGMPPRCLRYAVKPVPEPELQAAMGSSERRGRHLHAVVG